MATVLKPDICVIGAGSGGLTIAAAAASFGVSVVLIEKGKMGGDCLNYGCVPSKALIAAGKAADAMRHANKFGIKSIEPEVDFKAVHDHVHAVINAIAPNDSVERFTALGVKVIEATGKFIDKNTVEAKSIDGVEFHIKARRFVIATGSSAFVPPITGLSDVEYLTNETLFEQTKRPQKLIIIGGGPIGMEMAQAHQRLGSEVSVIEGAKALGKDDPELASVVLERLRQDGVNILEDTKVVSVERRSKNIIRVNAEGKDGVVTIEGSHILVAAGRKANVDGLGLEAANIKFDRRGISVGTNLRSSNRRVYAVGDVAGGLQFTHVAGYQAGLVIRALLFRLPIKNQTRHIPWSTYTDPELANVGMTEADARKANIALNVLRWPFHENDRAQAEKKTAGLIKVITDAKGKILGAGIAGAGAGEMINLWALAVSKNMSVRDIAGYVPPYPTMTEIGKRAAVSFYAPQTRKPFVRKLVGWLARFG
jgi:pyruvate/2-oxoglutarate dehydrogenase complex dihydrolipoamide dehydrogenase (E3) component